ncbi:peptide-methionine (R)-S-oxide reductase MsrB [Sulfurimonas sp. HSL-1716]|uniref:peptide-methionine (R)-S-oxide reductase MsrB n=1 Tax=Hydrocurvibacter sulfurireducens TaxID=3131937 RepID=UPI0031F9CC87
MQKISKTDKEWKEQLSAEAYEVCRAHGTEAPFSGKFYDFKGDGIYRCICCGQELFDSSTKYDSKTGWPSFYETVRDEAVVEEKDTSYGMTRVEVKCSKCDAHLGHVFADGPMPTGLRYCINSVCLEFKER